MNQTNARRALKAALFAFGFVAASVAAIPRFLGLFASFALAMVYALGQRFGRAFSLPSLVCYAVNTIDADLKVEVILDTFLEALVEELLPLSAFANDLSSAVIDEGDTVKLGYVPAATAARAFAGTYTIQASDWQKKEISVDQHDYVSWGLSDVDLFKGSLVNLQMHTRMKAQALASKVLTNLLSVVTAANYGAAAFTGAANTFDLDDVADLRTAAVKAKWPKAMRGLVLGADYYGNVIKDSNFQDVAAAGGAVTRETGTLPRLYTFTPYESESIPANAENLVGFMNIPSALGVVMRYLKPRRPEKYIEARPVSHKPTGITFGFRQDYDTKTGNESYIFECNYGKAVLEPEALKRLVSA